jgi:molybdopterin converting factor small subunit
MRVTVRLFARLRDLVGTGEAVCEVSDAARVADVWQALEREHPAIARSA